MYILVGSCLLFVFLMVSFTYYIRRQLFGHVERAVRALYRLPLCILVASQRSTTPVLASHYLRPLVLVSTQHRDG